MKKQFCDCVSGDHLFRSASISFSISIFLFFGFLDIFLPLTSPHVCVICSHRWQNLQNESRLSISVSRANCLYDFPFEEGTGSATLTTVSALSHLLPRFYKPPHTILQHYRLTDNYFRSCPMYSLMRPPTTIQII